MKLILSALALLSTLAFAGREDREYLKKETTSAVTKSEAAVKSACGCVLKF